MRVAWLNEAAVGKDPTGKVTGGLASVRYRCIIPQEELKGRGVESFLLGRIDKASEAVFLQAMDKVRPDVAVVGKVFNARVLDLLPLLKQRGIKLVADFCDNHFAKPETGPVHRALVKAADVVVAATPMMAEAITAATGKGSTLIPDPYEGPYGAPRFEPGQRLKLLWFGGRTNLDTIGPALPALDQLGATHPLSLVIFTDPDPQLDRLIESARGMFRNIAISFQPWSLDGQWQAIADCDAVIIPSLDNDTKNVKGPNRLIEAIRGGRPVAAYPLPSYQPFAEVCWLNPDVAEGLRAMLADPGSVVTKIVKGQKLVDELHGPNVIADRWLKLIEDATMKPAEPVPAAGAVKRNGEVVRLNLGCGDKILPGYVNIDLVDERAGHKPDIICDVRKLTPLPDEYADEAMAIHVVEHFWRWEVVDILKEWQRVLKPGGKIILECPNLLSACEAVLKNPEIASGPGKEGQRSMWVLYGDPSWKDPLMCHRWAYTPQSLGAVMHEAGFTQIRQEPAQYKLREPRDMRITGIKR
jgi:SAM-dependent methyltransferase